MKTSVFTILSVFILMTGQSISGTDSTPALFDIPVQRIQGDTVDLSDYKGNVLMIVNVASKCGNTPQYEQLQSIYEKYNKQGFTVLGFPANNFGAQEPGTNKEILQFCSTTYDVTFPMFAKISVKGDDKHPLYDVLTDKERHEFGGEINWNFEKFLIGRDGTIKARFAPGTKPDAPEVITALERELKS